MVLIAEGRGKGQRSQGGQGAGRCESFENTRLLLQCNQILENEAEV